MRHNNTHIKIQHTHRTPTQHIIWHCTKHNITHTAQYYTLYNITHCTILSTLWGILSPPVITHCTAHRITHSAHYQSYCGVSGCGRWQSSGGTGCREQWFGDPGIRIASRLDWEAMGRTLRNEDAHTPLTMVSLSCHCSLSIIRECCDIPLCACRDWHNAGGPPGPLDT